MTYPTLAECPFCNNAPRHLEAKTGFYTERVICDHCDFYLEASATQTAPERWNVCKTPTRSPEAASCVDEFRIIKECRDRFMVNSVSWKLLDDVLQNKKE